MPLLKDHYVDVTVGDLRLKGHRVAFSVEKTVKKEPNTCELAIWNLNPENRARLEELRPKTNDDRGIPVVIDAGYQDYFSQIWYGDLRTAESIYEKPNWVTKLDAGDGEKAYQTARIGRSFGKKTPLRSVIKALLDELGIGTGNLWKFEHSLKQLGASSIFTHGKVLHGPARRHLDDFARSADLEWSIQDGALQLVDRGKVLDAQAVLLQGDPNTGLLQGASVDNKGILTVKMLMIADVRVGGLLVLDSKRIKGNYRIEKANWVADTHSKSDWTITAECSRY